MPPPALTRAQLLAEAVDLADAIDEHAVAADALLRITGNMAPRQALVVIDQAEARAEKELGDPARRAGLVAQARQARADARLAVYVQARRAGTATNDDLATMLAEARADILRVTDPRQRAVKLSMLAGQMPQDADETGRRAAPGGGTP